MVVSGAPTREGEHGSTKQWGWQNFCKRSSKISPNPLLYSTGLGPALPHQGERQEVYYLQKMKPRVRGHQAQLRAENHNEKGLNESVYIECCDPQNANSQTYPLQEGNRKTCFTDNLKCSSRDPKM